MKKVVFILAVAAMIFGTTGCKKDYGSVDAKVAEELTKEMQESAPETAEETVAKNKKAGDDAVVAAMKADPEMKKTASGLVYKMVAPGAGANFKETDKVNVIYTGKHLDGSEFDSSKGNPVAMPVNGVVPGFKEMLQLMRPGAKAVCYIPGNLGYGEQGQPQGGIQPGEMLVFELETPGLAQ